MLAPIAIMRASTIHPAKRRCLSAFSSSRRSLSSTSSPDGPTPPYRVLFFGADTFSCEVFKRVYQAREGLLEQITVVTPPDQLIGKKNREVYRPPLRLLAEELNVPALALPKTLLKGWQPPDDFLLPTSPSISSATPSPSPQNLLLTASFGHLLPTSLLSLFLPLNALNVHPSLLPQYRGAAPIQHGIINGDADVEEGGSGMGVTVQELSRGRFDQGRILGQTRVDVPSEADFLTLEPILARAGGDLLTSILQNLSASQAAAYPQDPTLATLAPKLHKSSAQVEWSKMSATEVLRLQRGVGHQFPLWSTCTPPSSPPQTLQLRLSPFLLPLPTRLLYATPGTLSYLKPEKALVVRCQDSQVGVVVEGVKREGGRWVKAGEWWNGVKGKEEGVVLESLGERCS